MELTFAQCFNLERIYIPEVRNISNWAFAETGTKPLTIIMGEIVPNLSGYPLNLFGDITETKPVTVRVPPSVPSSGSGYGDIPADYSTETFIGTVDTIWSEKFRGISWNEELNDNVVNKNIHLFMRYWE